MYFQLQASTLPIGETEFGLLLTPSTVDIVPNETRFQKRTEYRKSVGRKWSPGSLTEQVFHGMLPTPTASDKNGSGSREALIKRGRGERNDLGSWATMNSVDGKNSQLSPQFVLEMMGFPTDWTLLPFLSGETNQ